MPSKEGEVPGKEGAGSGLSSQEVKINILWVWSTNVLICMASLCVVQ